MTLCLGLPPPMPVWQKTYESGIHSIQEDRSSVNNIESISRTAVSPMWVDFKHNHPRRLPKICLHECVLVLWVTGFSTVVLGRASDPVTSAVAARRNLIRRMVSDEVRE
ncbi:hypothetical protein KCU62_g413, partial [Aureobasidium sp. EXF-3399]